MTKHTPGPWVHANGDQIVATVRERTAVIADCYVDSGPQGSQVGPDQRAANARLIAAAPALLDALKAILAENLNSEHYTADPSATGWPKPADKVLDDIEDLARAAIELVEPVTV